MEKRLKQLTIILLWAILPGGLIQAQNPEFSVAEIPAHLTGQADAVTRFSETRIEVVDSRRMTMQVKEAVTVLNPRGDQYGAISVFYNNSQKINDLTAEIYDASGNLVRRVKQKDFMDQSAIRDYSLFEDIRVKYLSPSVGAYPYTILYQYELRKNNTNYFPDWFPARSPRVSVEQAVYEVRCGPDFDIRVNESRTDPALLAVDGSGNNVYTWQVSNLAATGEEPFAPPLRSYLPHVMVAPVHFRYEGLSGHFNTWDEYGRWIYQHLLSGRDEVPSETAANIRDLVADAANDREKVARVYRYVQDKNRYVSIQVGIGGLQPMEATEVDRLSYGDCKGLVNYTKALLSVVGINSIYTEVAAGDEQRSYLPEFASFGQGNHVILCVPLQADTIWLECTSKDAPLDYLGTFTADRNVLLITADEGKITRTPPIQNSRIQRNAVFDIHAEGALTVTIETDLTGAFYYDRHRLTHTNPREAQKAIQEMYPLPNLEIDNWEVSRHTDSEPLTKERLKLLARGYANFNGDRVFLPLNPFSRLSRIAGRSRLSDRDAPIWIPESFTEDDRFEFQFQNTLRKEYLPAKVHIEAPFGSFSASATMDEGRVIYHRVLQMRKGYYAAGIVEKMNEFFRQVHQADAQKAVLIQPD